MHVGGHSLQDGVRTMPWWIALGYKADDDTWLPGGMNSFYTLYNKNNPPGSNMDDADKYATQAKNMHFQLKKVIVGLTRDWKQQGQIWCWAYHGP